MEKKELTMELLLEFLDDKQKMELYELSFHKYLNL